MLAIITKRRRSKGCFGEGVRGIFALLLDKGKETSAPEKYVSVFEGNL